MFDAFRKGWSQWTVGLAGREAGCPVIRRHPCMSAAFKTEVFASRAARRGRVLCHGKLTVPSADTPGTDPENVRPEGPSASAGYWAHRGSLQTLWYESPRLERSVPVTLVACQSEMRCVHL